MIRKTLSTKKTVTVRYLKSDGTTGSFNITTKDAVCTDYGICNDEAGNIIILATTSFGKGPDRAYVLPKGATSGSACKAWKITDTDVTANQNRAWGLRAYGNTYSYNGYVSMCARQSDVGYRINLKGSDNTKTDGTVYATACSVAKYPMSVTDIQGNLVAPSYLGYGKLMVHAPTKGIYWVSQGSGAWTMTTPKPASQPSRPQSPP